jgi:hypothetical protein
MLKTYRVWLYPGADDPLIGALKRVPNKSAFINRALECYADTLALPGAQADQKSEQHQVHVSDPAIQALLDAAPSGHVGERIRRALWLQMGRSLGIDVDALAEKVVQNLLETGWAPSESVKAEEVPPEMGEFIGQF